MHETISKQHPLLKRMEMLSKCSSESIFNFIACLSDKPWTLRTSQCHISNIRGIQHYRLHANVSEKLACSPGLLNFLDFKTSPMFKTQTPVSISAKSETPLTDHLTSRHLTKQLLLQNAGILDRWWLEWIADIFWLKYCDGAPLLQELNPHFGTANPMPEQMNVLRWQCVVLQLSFQRAWPSTSGVGTELLNPLGWKEFCKTLLYVKHK